MDDKRRLYLRTEAYSTGFSDGASYSAMRTASGAWVNAAEDYERGYSDGKKARRAAVEAFAAEIGYKPVVLSIAGGFD